MKNTGENIKISIIIPAFNCEKTIERTIVSVLGQSLKAFEIIVVDDGSTDQTVKIVLEMQEKDCRIVLISQENKGVSAARNCGIENSMGKYIAFVDGDDCLENNALECLYKFAEKNKSQVVVAGMKTFYISKNNRSYEKSSIPPLIEEDIGVKVIFSKLYELNLAGTAGSKLFLKDFLNKCNLRFREFHNGEDRIFVIDCFNCAEKVSCVDDIVYIYYYGREGATCRFNDRKFLSMQEYYYKLRELVGDNRNLNIKPNEFLLRGAVSSMISTFDKSCKYSRGNKKKYIKDVAVCTDLKEVICRCDNKSFINGLIIMVITIKPFWIQKIALYCVYMLYQYVPLLLYRIRDRLLVRKD